MRGVLGPLEDPDLLALQPLTDAEQAVLAPLRAKAFVGTAAQVGDRLRALATQLQLDELVINSWSCDRAVRRRSCELLAAEFALERI